MKLTIRPAINHKLTESIQYYIFCSSEPSEIFSYQTFPNTNLCLSLYRSNKISHDKDTNYCRVGTSNSGFTSKLWGFHEKIFNVRIEAQTDQVCILFHPGGIRNFTDIPYEVLVNADDIFEMIFGKRGTDFLEQLFKTNDLKKRVFLLEQFLIKKLICRTINHTAPYAVQRIFQTDGALKIDALARELGINNATLYNNFISFIGQSPKDFIKTVRFRAALSALKKQSLVSLTDISYSANYYDQSHFIKECRQLTGYTPKEIRSKAVVEQEQLIWVNNFQLHDLYNSRQQP